MENLEWKIKNETESTSLDFKREQYHKENYTSLIKDVMAMANAPIPGPRYIVIGIKHRPDGTKEYHPVSELKDQADIENLIQDNVEPTVKFQYFPLTLDDVQLAIIKIEEPLDPPYMMKKDYKGGLKTGDAYIRKGSKQSRMTRRDLDEVLAFKVRNKFSGKIRVGFGTSLEQESTFNETRIDPDELPSHKQEKFYKEKLMELEESLALQQEQVEEESISEEKDYFPLRELFAKAGKIGVALSSNIYNDSIYVGSNHGIPLYLNKEELEERIANVKDNYAAKDDYFLKEICSEKLNFYTYNDGESFLEDVHIIFHFPKKYCVVIKNRPTKPVSSDLHSLSVASMHNTLHYPDVSENNEFYIVEEHIEKIRHKQLSQIFTEELRILFKPQKEGVSFDVEYEVHARNLPSPIKGILKINLMDTDGDNFIEE